MASAWGAAFGKSWGNAWGPVSGPSVEPPRVDPSWPKWQVTEQVQRATGGMVHLALDAARRRRRGW